MRVFIAAAIVAGLSQATASAQLKIVYGNNAGFGPDLVEKFDLDTGDVLQTYTPSGGNGRGVVVVGNILYSTQVQDPNIYMTDATTGAPLGTILTEQASLSTLAWDGATFWTTDYAGSNEGYQINTSGTTIKTISFSQSTGYMDGMEYFNGKLIVNNTDGGFGGPIRYSIYDLDGNLLQADFITSPNGTGIAFDGVNFLVSDIYNNQIHVYDGTTGAFIETKPLDGTHLIEDLSVNYAERPDTGCFYDFETEDDFSTPLGNGQGLTTPPEFGDLVSVSAAGANLGLVVFDSTPGGPNAGTSDEDMLIDKGNILMLQDSNYPAQTIAGYFDTPVDDPDGGDMIFDFTSPSEPQSVVLIDLDPFPNQGALVTLTDQAGLTRVYTVPAGWTGSFSSVPGWKALDLTTLAGQVGNPPGNRIATASEAPGFDAFNVTRIVVHMTGLGAIDDLTACSTALRPSVSTRNGSGTNHVSLTTTVMPVIGQTWSATLGCAGAGAGQAILSIRRQMQAGTASPFGEVLIGGTLLHRVARAAGAQSVLTWAIPNDPALLGLHVYAQGMCTSTISGGGKIAQLGGELSNALDLVLGF